MGTVRGGDEVEPEITSKIMKTTATMTIMTTTMKKKKDTITIMIRTKLRTVYDEQTESLS